MTTERIAELLKPFLEKPLSRGQLQSVGLHLDLLLKWNSKINLTAVRGPEAILARHFGESFFAAEHLFQPSDSGSAIDIGSGAGFPGLPLKLWSPSIEMTLIESNQRKATFLRETIRALELQGICVEGSRAETISIQADSTRADLVTLRAVERFEHILPIARGLVNPGGRLAILIGESQMQIATSMPTLAGVTWQTPIPITGSESRIILVGTV
jgi:16S rRNA (guanine527-N7)-methyltransferase